MLEALSSLTRSWRAGITTTNAWLTIPDALPAEIAARAGFASLCIDMQHGLIDHAAAVRILQATSGSGVPVLVRVPWNEPSVIMRALDAGAGGIIVPMVNSRAEAGAAVAACRYPPAGIRSYGPIRPALTDGPGYVDAANDAVLVFAMIETSKAIADLDAIAATPGLDGLYVGPADLSLALGLPPRQDSTVELHQATVKRIFAAAKQHGKVVGMHCNSAEFGAIAAEWGADMVTIAADGVALRVELVRRVARFEELVTRRE